MSTAHIALFDLDHTLIPFDSGMMWFRFLAAHGKASVTLPDAYLDRCHAYLAGDVTATELHQFVASTFRGHSPNELQDLKRSFAGEIADQIPPAAHRLVQKHLQREHRCCIVTATNRFVASAFAQALGIDELLATELETDENHFTGELMGAVCHGTEKVTRVNTWLENQALNWESVGHSVFYSDSASDLPLLQKVAEPIAVRPDPRLRDYAVAKAWRIAETLGDL